MNISLNSKIVLYPLNIRKDKKNYIVEEPISGDFFEIPEIGAEAIQRLLNGEALSEVEEILANTYPNEEVDIVDFVKQLVELGLVEKIDGVSFNQKIEKQKTTREKGFLWIPQNVGSLFFNKIMNKVYFIVFIMNILLLIVNPSLFPHYKDIFLFDSMVLNILNYLLISLLLIFIHEFGHILAIRSFNLPAKISVGNRLLFIVFETDLTSAWKLEPKNRYMLYFAGMSFEQMIVFFSFSFILLFPNNNFVGILSIIILDIFIKTIYQCCFYMKTDMYYVVENLTGCYNLMESGKGYLSSLFKKQRNNHELFQNEQKYIRLYSIFYIVGVCLTFVLAFLYFVPQLIFTYHTIYLNLIGEGDTGALIDAIAFVLLTTSMLILLIYLVRKQNREAQ